MNLFKVIINIVTIFTIGLYSYGQVMISQYIETNSGTTPKGIEIFNYSGSSIDFSATPLEVYQGTNGGSCSILPSATISSGVLGPSKVWVIGTSDLTVFSSSGTDTDGITTYAFSFNGDDALALYLGGVLMDVMGTCLSDPGSSWSGSGVATANQNIAVKIGVCTGTSASWTDPSIRFEKIAEDTMTGFGEAPVCVNNTITITSLSSLTYSVDCFTSATGTLNFTSIGTFTAGNTFTAELSDATGSFASSTVIGTLTSSGVNPSGTINITIPANFAAGTNYRVRVIGDNPVSISADNGSDITITNTSPCLPPSINNTVSSTSFTVDCSTTATGTVNFTAIGIYTAGNTFTAELSDATGSFASSTSIGSLSLVGTDPSGTINITIPANFASGTGYRIRVVSDTPVITGLDNGSDITISNSAPCAPSLPSSGGLLINEFSNGPTGSQEYYEFIVAGQCGDVVDVSGYIIDDNNGTFSTTGSYPSSSGIASGYLQLTNHSQWTAIPVGSVIVVFNAADRNPSLPVDDPFDSNTDSLYVIPHNNTALFIIRTDIPNASTPDSSYFPTVTASTSWNPLGIANTGDAIQVRQPNGDYFFGVSYGGSEISGGPDNTKISTINLGGSNGYFSNGDFRDIANWAVGNAPADETPGTYNNPLNETWLRAMRDPNAATCPITPLPIELITFKGIYNNNQVDLQWKSATEQNNDYYTVKHSTNGYNFSEIGQKKGAGSVSTVQVYDMVHRNPNSGINYYQLSSTDYDGTKYEKGIISVLVDRDEIIYNQFTSQLIFPELGDYILYNTSGQKIAEIQNQSHFSFHTTGIYLIYNQKSGVVTKIAIP